jgi:hypothetical protein
MIRRSTMGAMDARRLELYELLKPKLDEEPARRLVLELPASPERLATNDVVLRVKEAIEEQLHAMEDRLTARVEVTAAKLESVLTRRMIATIGAWTILVGSTIGWVAALLH